MKLLEVKDLKTYFHTENGVAKAVDGVSFSLEPGQVLGLVGESGSGKSVTSLSIMGLISKVTGRYEGGQVLLEGRDILGLSEKEMTSIRGSQISMIFQEPMTSLNPVLTIEFQMVEAIRLHMKMSRKEARERARTLLEQVGIPDPARRLREFPSQLSGGMRQRVMIAMALACEPKILIADEPTTALDVTIQAQILDLINDLRRKMNIAVIFITHDLGVISQLADEVAVMYAGEIIEQAPAKELFAHPLHPYTKGLLRSIPDLTVNTERLYGMEGLVPSLYDMPQGCHFGPRCQECEKGCTETHPQLLEIEPGHLVRCCRCGCKEA